MAGDFNFVFDEVADSKGRKSTSIERRLSEQVAENLALRNM